MNIKIVKIIRLFLYKHLKAIAR